MYKHGSLALLVSILAHFESFNASRLRGNGEWGMENGGTSYNNIIITLNLAWGMTPLAVAIVKVIMMLCN